MPFTAKIALLVIGLIAVAAVEGHGLTRLATTNGGTSAGVTDYMLDSQFWTLFNQGANVTIENGCAVPGDVYTCMMAHDVIGDPYYRYGDLNYRWVAFDNWTYTNSIFVSSVVLENATVVELVLEGMQVVADVFINDVLVGKTNDQFLEYRFDVTDQLVGSGALQIPTGGVQLNVRFAFTSSVAYATQKYQDYNTTFPKPVAPDYLMGLPHRNFVRTEQSSFGWDWGPAMAPCGINKPVLLRVFKSSHAAPSAATIDHVVPHMFPLPFNRTVPVPISDEKNAFLVNLRVYFTISDALSNVKVFVSGLGAISYAANQTDAVLEPDDVSPKLLRGFASVDVTLRNVPLWWPTGYGAQNFVHFNVSLVSISSGFPLAQQTIRTGIRAVELVTWGDPLNFPNSTSSTGGGDESYPSLLPGDAIGDRPVMFFRVNGYPIFAKGANLIPFDAFQPRVNDTVIADILHSAVEANMNMIRIWGGGIFQTDSLYDMADELGLLVWQEMIFACAEYPIDQPFLDNVKAEIRHQLRRLGRHPSIVVWSGNNENGVYDEGPGSPYEILDYDNVMQTIITEDTSRPVWPSSPSTGYAYGVTASGLPAGTMSNPLPFKVGGRSGDTHFYNYENCPNVSVYPRSNFGSEFGFQSLPWLENFAPVSKPEDWSLFSPLMNHRQHHPDGNAEIANLLHQNFRVPNLNTTALDIFKRVIFLSQLQQTLCIADEASFYRRGRSMPYRTSGSLYWQLNQNWQAPSWTSIEYGGEWKVLHYAMKTVYSRFHVSAFHNETTDEIIAHVASDAVKPVVGAVATAQLIPFDATAESFTVNNDYVVATATVTIPALSGVFFFNRTKESLLAAYGSRCPTAQHCFLYFRISTPQTKHRRAATGAALHQHRVADAERDGAVLARAQPLWLTKVKDVLIAPNLTVSVVTTAVTVDTAAVELSTVSGVALFVFVKQLRFQGRFDDNMLVLLSGQPRTLTFTLRQYTSNPQTIPSIAAFQAGLEVNTLNDMWQ